MNEKPDEGLLFVVLTPTNHFRLKDATWSSSPPRLQQWHTCTPYGPGGEWQDVPRVPFDSSDDAFEPRSPSPVPEASEGGEG